MTIRILRAAQAFVLPAVLLAASPIRAQAPGTAPDARYPTVAPGVYLIPEPGGNLLVMVGPDGALVVGAQAPSRVAKARELLASLGNPPVRYALVTSGDSVLARGDGGWERAGAVSVAHERIRSLFRRAAPAGRLRPGAMPSLGYSEVFQLAINGDEIHVVHQAPGFSDGDASIHFEERRFLYLGALFTNDGYPSIDLARNGSFTGLIQTADKFLEMFGEDPRMVEPLVPGRGPLATIRDLSAYRDMLVGVRDRVQPMVQAGRTLEEVLASRPTAAFDARWGSGPVAPDQFVTTVYRSLAKSGTR